MSHDRGCFKCHEDPPYTNCTVADCPKRKPIPGPTIADTVRLSRQIITVTEPGYDVALFFNADGGAEAVISRPNDKPTNVNIAPPETGRRIVVERKGGVLAVMYKDA